MTTWLWVGCIGMSLGALALLSMYRSVPDKEQHHVVASFWVCAIAAGSYLAMAFGQGDITVHGKEVFVARYIDWTLTTPLLLLGLLTLGLVGSKKKEIGSFVAGVLAADVFMIATGLMASLSSDATHKWVWYGASCLAFLSVVYAVWLPVRKAAHEMGVGSLYDKLAGLLTGLWFIYPILWVFGTEGTSTISLNSEVAVFAVIDLLAKVGFGLMLVTGVRSLASKSKTVEV